MAEPAMLKMSCASCGEQILFTKQQVGQTSKCPHCQNYIQFKSGVSVEEFFGWIFFAGLCLMAAGIGFVVYYFHFYSLASPGADVVNDARMHRSLCGIIIGVGLGLAGIFSAWFAFAIYCITGALRRN